MLRPRLTIASAALTMALVGGQVLAAVALGTLGRALWHLALDAFVLYVFGDPAQERRGRSGDDVPSHRRGV